MTRKRISRRQAISGMSAIGALTLAGCTGDGNGGGNGDGNGGGNGGGNGDGNGGGNGDGNGDGNGGGGGEQTLTMYTSTESTAAYQMSQGLAAIMDQNSDSIRLDARPSDGARQGMRLMDRGEADIAYTDALNAFQIANDEGQYADQPFENEIRQLWHFYDIQSGFVVSGDSDFYTYDDLGPAGATVTPHPAGSAQRVVYEIALGYAEESDNMEYISIDYNQEPSALQSGRADAVTDLRINADLLPSYNQELYSINENARMLHWPEDMVEEIQNDDRITGDFYSTEEMEALPSMAEEGGEELEEEWWMELIYISFAKSSLDADLVYDFMNTIWENIEAVEEYHSLGGAWSDEEFLTQGLREDIPVHEGAARFYDELGVDYPDP